MKVKKAIIPAAGLGTRMLPATRSIPKEMLTIVDKPVIQYVLEHALSSGIEEVLIILSKGKEAIINHFDLDPSFLDSLKVKGKLGLVGSIAEIASKIKIEYTYQKEQKGLGDAILCAQDFANGEPVAVLLGDSIIASNSDEAILKQMIRRFEEKRCSTVAITEVPMSQVSRYGVMKGLPTDEIDTFKVMDWIEKPQIEEAPSNLVISGLYLFTPTIFQKLENLPTGIGGEVQLTDAMRLLLKDEEMYGFRYNGTRYDIGNKVDLIKTNLILGMKDQAIGSELSQWIESI